MFKAHKVLRRAPGTKEELNRFTSVKYKSDNKASTSQDFFKEKDYFKVSVMTEQEECAVGQGLLLCFQPAQPELQGWHPGCVSATSPGTQEHSSTFQRHLTYTGGPVEVWGGFQFNSRKLKFKLIKWYLKLMGLDSSDGRVFLGSLPLKYNRFWTKTCLQIPVMFFISNHWPGWHVWWNRDLETYP